MQLNAMQIAAVAAAVVVMFWPQIAPMLRGVAAKVKPAGGTSAEPAGPDRSAWVTQLLSLQEATRAYGNPKAAALIGQAVVDLVSSESDKPPSLRGGKP